MGIFDFLKGSKNDTPKSTNSEFPEFVTDDESEGLDQAILTQLEQMMQTLKSIKEYPSLSNEASNLLNGINELANLLRKTNKEDSFAIQNKFNNYKTELKKLSIKASREQSLDKLKHLNNDLKLKLDEPFSNISSDYIDKYIDAIEGVQKRESDSRKEEKIYLPEQFRKNDPLAQDFHKASYEAEYRIRLLKVAKDISSNPDNPFTKFDEHRKNMYLSFFNQDLKDAIEKYNNFILKHKDFFMQKRRFLWDILDDDIIKIDNILGIEVCKNPELKSIISKNGKNESDYFFEIISLLLKIKNNINQLETELNIINSENKTNKLLAEKKAQQKKQYATMSGSEIEATLDKFRDEISLEYFPSSNPFVEMLDFQKRVAVAQKLLPENINNALSTKSANILEAYQLLQKVNRSGAPCLIFPDCQEYGDGNFLFVTSKTNQNILDLKPMTRKQRTQIFEEVQADSFEAKDYDYIDIGELPDFLLDVFHKVLSKKEQSSNLISEFLIIVPNSKTGMYKIRIRNQRPIYTPYLGIEYLGSSLIKHSQESFKEIVDEIKSAEGKNEQLKNVLSYIHIPANMNMLILLDELKKANIAYYFEPLPEGKRNTLHRDKIHIYYKRENDDAVKKVLKRLHDIYKGNIGRSWTSSEDISFGKKLAEEINRSDTSRVPEE